MRRQSVLALALSACVLLPQPTRASSSQFDGVWRVTLVSLNGPCGDSAHAVLIVRNGVVSAGSSNVSISGSLSPSGSVTLSLQRDGVQGSASGHLSGSSGAGHWSVASYGCSGQWVARHPTTASSLTGNP